VSYVDDFCNGTVFQTRTYSPACTTIANFAVIAQCIDGQLLYQTCVDTFCDPASCSPPASYPLSIPGDQVCASNILNAGSVLVTCLGSINAMLPLYFTLTLWLIYFLS
jgi:hypothetical protein